MTTQGERQPACQQPGSQHQGTAQVDGDGASQAQANQSAWSPAPFDDESDPNPHEHAAQDAGIEGCIGTRHAKQMDNLGRKEDQQHAQSQVDGGVDQQDGPSVHVLLPLR